MIGVTEQFHNGVLVLEVDTKKAMFKGFSWESLGSFGRRKMENLLVIENSKRGVVKVQYV